MARYRGATTLTRSRLVLGSTPILLLYWTSWISSNFSTGYLRDLYTLVPVLTAAGSITEHDLAALLPDEWLKAHPEATFSPTARPEATHGPTPQLAERLRLVINEANRCKAARIKVVTISLGTGADRTPMQQVADITGGVHFNIPGGQTATDYERDLNDVFQKIAWIRPLKLVK